MMKGLFYFILFFSLQVAADATQPIVGPRPIPDGVARIVVHPQTRTYNIERQNFFQGHETEVVRTDGASTHLGTFRQGFGDIGSSLEFNIVNSMGQYSRLDLPESVEERILHFLEVGPPANIVCDCHCFASRAAGLNYPHSYLGGEFQASVGLMERGSEFVEVHSEAQMNPGDAILLTRRDENNNQLTIHSMIYLGEGLFLSKLGDGGTLVVTNLREIQRAYPTDQLFIYPPNESEGVNQEPQSPSHSVRL